MAGFVTRSIGNCEGHRYLEASEDCRHAVVDVFDLPVEGYNMSLSDPSLPHGCFHVSSTNEAFFNANGDQSYNMGVSYDTNVEPWLDRVSICRDGEPPAAWSRSPLRCRVYMARSSRPSLTFPLTFPLFRPKHRKCTAHLSRVGLALVRAKRSPDHLPNHIGSYGDPNTEPNIEPHVQPQRQSHRQPYRKSYSISNSESYLEPHSQPDGQPGGQPDGQPDRQPDRQPDHQPDHQPDG